MELVAPFCIHTEFVLRFIRNSDCIVHVERYSYRVIVRLVSRSKMLHFSILICDVNMAVLHEEIAEECFVMKKFIRSNCLNLVSSIGRTWILNQL